MAVDGEDGATAAAGGMVGLRVGSGVKKTICIFQRKEETSY
jgi:hypothetical protein